MAMTVGTIGTDEAPPKTRLTIEDVAGICYEAHRFWRYTLNDFGYSSWTVAPPQMRAWFVEEITPLIEDPGLTPYQQHYARLIGFSKREYIYGPERDATKKTDPAVVEFDKLDRYQLMRYALFRNIVETVRPIIEASAADSFEEDPFADVPVTVYKGK